MENKQPESLFELAIEAAQLTRHLQRLADLGSADAALEQMMDEGVVYAQRGDSPLGQWLEVNMPHVSFGAGINPTPNGGWAVELVLSTSGLTKPSETQYVEVSLPKPLAELERAFDEGWLYDFLPDWKKELIND